MAGIELSHIFKKYDNADHYAVEDFNLSIDDNEFIVFVGPSGCGKSTTLRMIAGLEEITKGNLYIGDMVECPDLLFFETMDVFLLSAMNYTDKKTGQYYPHISWLIEGQMDWDKGIFEPTSIRKMDDGFDFYAPQTAKLNEKPNEYVALAWHQAWGRTLPTHDEGHHWAGQMTIPRLLREEQSIIKQMPLPQLMQQFKKGHTEKLVEQDTYNISDISYLKVSLTQEQKLSMALKNSTDQSISLIFDTQQNEVQFSREKTLTIQNEAGEKFEQKTFSVPITDEDWTIEMFIDRSSIQIFINDYATFSSTYYTEEPLNQLEITGADEQMMDFFQLKD